MIMFPSLSPYCDVQLPSGSWKGMETANKARAQMRWGRRTQGNGRPAQMAEPHSQVLDACRRSGQPHTDPDPRTCLQGLKPTSILPSFKDLSDRDPISVLNNTGTRATCSRKYLLEREH